MRNDMADATFTHAPSITLVARAQAMKANLSDAWNRYRTFNATYNELTDLSDRELSDLGLSRSMIRSIAYETAYGA